MLRGNRQLEPAAAWYFTSFVGSFFVLRDEKRTDGNERSVMRKIFGYIRARFANTPPTPISQPPIPAPKALRIRRRATFGSLAAQRASNRFGRAFGRVGSLLARQ